MQDDTKGEWPKEMVNIPDPNESGARIVGFRIREGDAAFGVHGLSEPLFWLKRVCCLYGD